jgi:uncharacterized repeat protein (TIGR03943 family)
MLVLGVLALRLALTDAYLAYVRPGMKLLLIGAGAVLVALGGTVLLGRRAWSGDVPDHDDTAGHRHAPMVAWLLILPVLAIALVAPAPLGAFAAARAANQPPGPAPISFDPLPARRDGAVDLTLKDFTARAFYDRRSLSGVPVRLLGFAAPDPHGGGFLLVRFVLTCCAADGRPVKVAIRGVAPPYPATNTWVELVGTWRPTAIEAEDPPPPELVAASVRPIPPPTEPYLT